jgi:tRNA splicing endonuclease
MKFHAQYIVMCRLPSESFSALSLISLCRVGASVKKAILLATFDDANEDEVKFETISWLT